MLDVAKATAAIWQLVRIHIWWCQILKTVLPLGIIVHHRCCLTFPICTAYTSGNEKETLIQVCRT